MLVGNQSPAHTYNTFTFKKEIWTVESLEYLFFKHMDVFSGRTKSVQFMKTGKELKHGHNQLLKQDINHKHTSKHALEKIKQANITLMEWL